MEDRIERRNDAEAKSETMERDVVEDGVVVGTAVLERSAGKRIGDWKATAFGMEISMTEVVERRPSRTVGSRETNRDFPKFVVEFDGELVGFAFRGPIPAFPNGTLDAFQAVMFDGGTYRLIPTFESDGRGAMLLERKGAEDEKTVCVVRKGEEDGSPKFSTKGAGNAPLVLAFLLLCETAEIEPTRRPRKRRRKDERKDGKETK